MMTVTCTHCGQAFGFDPATSTRGKNPAVSEAGPGKTYSTTCPYCNKRNAVTIRDTPDAAAPDPTPT